MYELRHPEYVFVADGGQRLRWRIARLASPTAQGPRASIDLVPTVAYAWLPRAGASELLAWMGR